MLELIGSTPAPGLALAHVWGLGARVCLNDGAICSPARCLPSPFAWSVLSVWCCWANLEGKLQLGQKHVCCQMPVGALSIRHWGTWNISLGPPWQAGMILTDLPWPRDS